MTDGKLIIGPTATTVSAAEQLRDAETPAWFVQNETGALLISRRAEYMTVLIESQGEDLRMWAENKIAEYRTRSRELQVDRGVEPPKIEK